MGHVVLSRKPSPAPRRVRGRARTCPAKPGQTLGPARSLPPPPPSPELTKIVLTPARLPHAFVAREAGQGGHVTWVSTSNPHFVLTNLVGTAAAEVTSPQFPSLFSPPPPRLTLCLGVVHRVTPTCPGPASGPPEALRIALAIKTPALAQPAGPPAPPQPLNPNGVDLGNEWLEGLCFHLADEMAARALSPGVTQQVHSSAHTYWGPTLGRACPDPGAGGARPWLGGFPSMQTGCEGLGLTRAGGSR